MFLQYQQCSVLGKNLQVESDGSSGRDAHGSGSLRSDGRQLKPLQRGNGTPSAPTRPVPSGTCHCLNWNLNPYDADGRHRTHAEYTSDDSFEDGNLVLLLVKKN